jgi:ABC-2 type transport system ATP-binding protein
VKELSKGMVAQLHLAIVMAIDARLLVLDEPTLGLDIVYRKRFYDSLLEDYYERDRTIILATHNVEEIEHVVTDVIFLDRGRVVLSASMDEVEARYREVRVHPDHLAQARGLVPIHEREALGQHIMLFDGVAPDRLTALGDVRRPSVADLFLARVGGEPQEVG